MVDNPGFVVGSSIISYVNYKTCDFFVATLLDKLVFYNGLCGLLFGYEL